MTVLEFVNLNKGEDIFCETDERITLCHVHKSRKGNLALVKEFFKRCNSMPQVNWEKYASYETFANKEIVKQSICPITKRIYLYVHFSQADWTKEIANIFKDNKRDFNYFFLK